MIAAGCPIFIIEGGIRNTSLPYKSVLGAARRDTLSGRAAQPGVLHDPAT